MGRVELLKEAQAVGFTIQIEGERLIIHGPKSAERIAQALLVNKKEVIQLLDAMDWLRGKLAEPRHIAECVAEWVGTLEQPTGRTLDDLMEAPWSLGVQPFIGKDDRFWWRLQKTGVQ